MKYDDGYDYMEHRDYVNEIMPDDPMGFGSNIDEPDDYGDRDGANDDDDSDDGEYGMEHFEEEDE